MLWAIYSDDHSEVDVAGDRDGLRELAGTLTRSLDAGHLILDEPPADWQASGHRLAEIHVEPAEEANVRICFSRDGEVLVFSGTSAELARIVGGPIGRLAEGPSRINSVLAHVHLDPTSDPEKRWYSPDSISLVVGFANEAE